MLELLNSNYMPVKTPGKTFEEIFWRLLQISSEVKIASGYISEDSITDLISLYKSGLTVKLTLIVGMHLFEGFSQGQYDALMSLSDILKQKQLGGIYIAASVKYHGKLYLFQSEKKKAAVIGSSNLTKISKSDRIYDTDVLTDDRNLIYQVENFIILMQEKNCELLQNIDKDCIRILPPENLFENYLSVRRIKQEELADIQNSKTPIVFDIPLKTEEKSNLNCYFGKPRKNSMNGTLLPRHWYEAELIVPNTITRQEGYPKKGEEFSVITDDGYNFKCKTSGVFSKNFRSADNLCILGKWLKGRMENASALKIGMKVTADTLQKYGRNTITLTKTTIPNTWYLDFGV